MCVHACGAHSNSASLPHPQLLPGAGAGAAVNYGCTGPDQEYRSCSPANERCIALTAGLELGWGWSKYRDASNPSAWAVWMTTGRDREGHVQDMCERMRMGVACRWRKFKKVIGGRGMGGA